MPYRGPTSSKTQVPLDTARRYSEQWRLWNVVLDEALSLPQTRPIFSSHNWSFKPVAQPSNQVARFRVDKEDKPVTYEEVHGPHYIAHRKGRLSLHTGNLYGEDHAAEQTVEDVFLQKFMLGTFPVCLADPRILKRRAHQLEVSALVLRQLPAHKFHLLVGYNETLLSPCYKRPVCLHLQTVPSKVVYKYT
ncbi:28S ribosomal protein S24, mitochondrial-like [Ursus maritimus]|uniref:28S ribosomal protein S24, mitochondrial-like n=2 Tax=Ursus maritimus TaxID=29073 RepID=A0A384CTR5_URSMA|nr:28S ribosomal protein S24, mitochondrial-like [Ursus maritimus]